MARALRASPPSPSAAPAGLRTSRSGAPPPLRASASPERGAMVRVDRATRNSFRAIEHVAGEIVESNAARGGVVTVLEEEAESGETRREEAAQRKLATRASARRRARASGAARRSGRGLEPAMAGSNEVEREEEDDASASASAATAWAKLFCGVAAQKWWAAAPRRNRGGFWRRRHRRDGVRFRRARAKKGPTCPRDSTSQLWCD